MEITPVSTTAMRVGIAVWLTIHFGDHGWKRRHFLARRTRIGEDLGFLAVHTRSIFPGISLWQIYLDAGLRFCRRQADILGLNRCTNRRVVRCGFNPARCAVTIWDELWPAWPAYLFQTYAL
jgi:hypothetical protein